MGDLMIKSLKKELIGCKTLTAKFQEQIDALSDEIEHIGRVELILRNFATKTYKYTKEELDAL